MRCQKLDTDFCNFLEIVYSEKRGYGRKKCVSYYPFGLEHKGYNNVTSGNVNSIASKFKYNRKELEESLGYNMYEYEARHYDASLGRFVTIDPLAEDYSFQSPYAYAVNDPIRFIDKFGMGPDDWVKNLETCEYEWKNEVTSESNTPEGYKYVGESDQSIVEDLVGKQTVKTDTATEFGSVSHNDETTAHGYGASANNATANSKMQVSLRADVTEVRNESGELVSKEFNGIEVNVRSTSEINVAVIEGKGMSLQPESVTLNGSEMTNTTGEANTFYVPNSKTYRGKVSAGQLSSSDQSTINVSLKGIFLDTATGAYLKLPGMFGLSGIRNTTSMGTSFNVDNE